VNVQANSEGAFVVSDASTGLLAFKTGEVQVRASDTLSISAEESVSIAGKGITMEASTDSGSSIVLKAAVDVSFGTGGHVSLFGGGTTGGSAGSVRIGGGDDLGSGSAGTAGNVVLTPGVSASGTSGALFVGDTDALNLGVRKLYTLRQDSLFSGTLASASSTSADVAAASFSSALVLANDKFSCTATVANDVGLWAIFPSCAVDSTTVRIGLFNAGGSSATISSIKVIILLVET